MAVYSYRARDTRGEMVTGRVEGADEAEVFRRLREQGLVTVFMEVDRDIARLAEWWRASTHRRIKHRQLALFCRQFATMFGAGVPVVESLLTLARQSTDPTLRRAVERVAHHVSSGETLATAFSRLGEYFPPLLIHLIAAGEAGGMLEEVLQRLAEQLEHEEMLRQKIRSALTYPVTVSVLACGVVLFLMLFVLPRFMEVYDELGVSLPLITRGLIMVWDLFTRWWWVSVTTLLAAILTLVAAARTPAGALRLDQLLLRLPIAGAMLLKAAIARFCRTLGGLLQSGVPIIRALLVVERVIGNRALAAAMRQVREEVGEGHRLADPLSRARLFPPMVLEMVAVGEETGQLEQMLGKIAVYYEDDVRATADRLASVVEPVLIAGLAVTVGLIVVSMLLPLFDIWTLLS